MLEPRDRQLLFEALQPPNGFHFDQGIGTTYTLDLLALLTAPLAFTFFEQQSDEGGNVAVDSLESTRPIEYPVPSPADRSA